MIKEKCNKDNLKWIAFVGKNIYCCINNNGRDYNQSLDVVKSLPMIPCSNTHPFFYEF
jgi:hypothetical protein